MKKIIQFAFLFIISSISLTSQNLFRLGVNLDDNGAFINIVNHTNRISKATGYDSLGWPTSDFDIVLMDGRPVPEWNGVIDDPEQYRVDYSGIYKCCFQGIADVTASGTSVSIQNKNFDTISNTTYFDLNVGGYPQANHGLVFLSFTNTKRNINQNLSTGITKLIVNRPGYELGTKSVFTDEYIRLCKSADFACYRFYNVQNIWDGEPTYPQKTTWDKRKTPNDASQKPLTATGKIDGWSWEYITELANILGKDIWINIHISCDSNYVVSLAKYLKANLNPSINIYVENSNEVWSPTQAKHGPYNKSQADKYKISFDQNYARRTVELSNWFSEVFGKDEINNRIRIILAGQEAYSGRSDIHLNYIKNTYGEPKNYVYATSSALYFESTQSSSADTSKINDGMLEDINNQITNTKAGTYRLNHLNKAKTWGLTGGCTSYEGGPSIPAGGVTTNLGPQIMSNRTYKMKEIIKKNYLDGWKDLGGGLALYFTLTSGYNRYGCWGLTDDYKYPDRNYKMEAVREIISNKTGVNDSHKNSKLFVTQNPVSDNLNIEFPESSEQICNSLKKIVIYSIEGIEYQIPFDTDNPNNLQINVTSLQPGLYIIQIGNLIEKFIKL